MGLFRKDKEEEKPSPPTTIFQNPSLRVLEGFSSDSETQEPIVRLTKQLRERFSLKRGDFVALRKGEMLVKARVEVSSAQDGGENIVRLNPRSRELLNVSIGDEIEIIPPETCILLIDTSGSMADFVSGIVKMEATKNAVIEFIRSKFLLTQGDRIGIISFGEFATVVERPSMKYEYLENRSRTLQANGSTAMYEGMSLDMDIMPQSGVKRIVLLTDGVPTTTGKFSIISLAKSAAQQRIVIDTVGVGSPFDFMGYDEPLLRRIAAITGGTFRRVLDIQELSDQFRKLAIEKNYTYLLPEK
ncbi:MAG: VWA domain-containing protein [Spirochaetota bacterium]|nr:MAG: VWA domain-containing protein [Spirochaetota bacterium]